jgi:hypothetical protein
MIPPTCPNFRHIGPLGLWRSFSEPLDPAPMAAAFGRCGHRSKRVGPHCACSGYVGAAVERLKGLHPVRQHGRCVCCKQEISPQSDPLQALRLLCLFCAIYDITLFARHLPGANNAAADALSRDNLRYIHVSQPTGLTYANSDISSSTRHAVERANQHELSDLDYAVERYFGSGIAHSTRSAYACAVRRYFSFCQQFNVECQFPLTEATLCRFVAFLGQQNLKHRTIKSYLSGLRFTQINQGLGNPFREDMPRLNYVLTRIKREQARKGSVTKPRLPITIDVLCKLKQVWLAPPVTFDDKMLWAAACTGFFGFLRVGEFTVPSCHRQPPHPITYPPQNQAEQDRPFPPGG